MKRSSFKVETKQSLIQTAKEAGRNTKKAQKALAQKEENSCLNGKEMKDSKHRAAFPLEGKQCPQHLQSSGVLVRLWSHMKIKSGLNVQASKNLKTKEQNRQSTGVVWKRSNAPWHTEVQKNREQCNKDKQKWTLTFLLE